MQAINTTFGSLGLYTPTRRFVAFAALSGAAFWYIKPDSMFFDGYARPWSFFSGGGGEDDDDARIPATTLPWWLASGLIGMLAALML
jgi:hypothetical protein